MFQPATPWRLRDGYSFAQIIHNYYPDLTEEDILACVQYAPDIVAVEDLHLSPATG
jgi:uncharacterized protein (DUF433 family)